MEKARIAVVGLGTIGQTIHLPILSKFPDAEIVAVCDYDSAKAEFVAKKYEIPRWYDNLETMLKAEEDIVGVDICTSTFTHADVAIAALESKKHILVEKPLARTQKEAMEIINAAKKHQRKVMVGMNNRFRPDAMILKSMIQGGELGKIYYTKAGWLKKLSTANPWLTRKEKSGGGVVLDLGIVMFDLAFWMMGFPEAKEVIAANYSHNTKGVEDSSVVFIKMQSGSTLTIESSWSFESNSDFFYCDCFGTDGSGSLNPFRILKRMHGNLVNVTPVSNETPQSLYWKSYDNELKHWIGSLRGLHPIISTGEEAVHRMKVVDAIYQSAKKGKSTPIK
ncbi:MAG: Gfo/Idh/MocA family oxidoreductase [Ignavibacteriales bacterium]|nr:Gfo/Idh/MocA family oxidoreductase [Ignavibacteriales bacterium]MBI3788182.1 Gfo/Idh/MocA family oxidoreductase [Ignavibacteriales bacterium]